MLPDLSLTSEEGNEWWLRKIRLYTLAARRLQQMVGLFVEEFRLLC